MKGTLASGEPCSIIFLDTEGIGGVEGDSKYDARIFSLAILLCSTLIYNSLGSIDENAISNLSFIAQLSNHIKLSASSNDASGSDTEEGDNTSEFCKIFPAFIWVVRDFSLQLVDQDGDEITPTQYLNAALEQTSGYDKQTMERNRTRGMLSAFFPDRQCVTLVRPLSDEAALQQVDQVPYDSLRPDFQRSMEVLQHTVFDALRPKSIDNKPLTGPMFAGIVAAYVAAINAGGVPTISSAWEGVSRQECLDAKEHARTIYASEMSERCPLEKLPVEEEELHASHVAAETRAVSAYRNRAVGISVRDVLTELQRELDKSLASLREANREASATFCEATVTALYDETIRPNLIASSEATLPLYATDLSAFRAHWTALYEDYTQRARGPSKWHTLSHFSRSRLLECTQAIVTAVKDSYEETLSVLKEQALQTSSALAAQEAQWKVLEDKSRSLEKEYMRAEAEIADLMSRVASSDVLVEELTAAKRAVARDLGEEKDVRLRSEAKTQALGERVRELEGKETECFDLTAERDALRHRVTELEEELREALAAKKKKKCVIS